MEHQYGYSGRSQCVGLVGLAAGCGAIIGVERELSDKPAGLRPNIFVAVGSTLLMLLGQSVVDKFAREGGEFITADPIRVLQAIVVGISFLGAGTIIHQGGNRVEGLTTAASIFLTAGIGVAVAIQRLLLAGSATLFAVAVLTVMGWVENRLGSATTEAKEKTDDG